jgi:hypothetical protein
VEIFPDDCKEPVVRPPEMRVGDNAYLQPLPSRHESDYIARGQKDKSFLACAQPVPAFGLTFQGMWL